MTRLSEALLRIYRELVRGRTTVRVQPASAPRQVCAPIFIMGVFRSGTTLTRYVIDSHSQIACPPESNFVRALAPILGDPDNREGLVSLGYDQEHVLARLREFVAYYFENYARSHNKARWADKTPAYVEHLEFVDRLFPAAQFVMTYRHPLDVAHSITNGGTKAPPYLQPYIQRFADARVAAAAYWGDRAGRMLAFEAAHPQRCHRLLYEQLCRSPEPQLRSLFGFLGEAWEPGVLEYWKFPHDRGFEDGRVGATRGFSISEGHYRAWPSNVVAEAVATAAAPMQQLGYRVDASVPEAALR